MKDYLEKRREELRKRSDKGFTLMEMLIVVAIIAVLIAIAIPVFTAQLEKAREATDLANIRSAYAEVSANYLSDNKAHSIAVELQSNTSDYQSTGAKVANIDGNLLIGPGAKTGTIVDTDGKKTVTVAITNNGAVTIGAESVTSGMTTT